MVLVASKSGAKRHPEWYLNLSADPKVTVQIGRERVPMRASTATEEEKTRLWPPAVQMHKSYEAYQRKEKP